MKDWKGDRGFDQHIENLVENDMPVFMIGDQRDTMEPFSGSQAGHQMSTNDLDIPNLMKEIAAFERSRLGAADSEPLLQQPSPPTSGTHSYREIEALLLKYVLDELGHGRVPCDGQLQQKTSEITYGPDNAWDPTWADNPEWLSSFKKKAGLISLPFTSGKNAFIGSNTT